MALEDLYLENHIGKIMCNENLTIKKSHLVVTKGYMAGTCDTLPSTEQKRICFLSSTITEDHLKYYGILKLFQIRKYTTNSLNT